ncbi:BBP7 family outer membrane beta-barrel protein [Anatilimnocola floriformis]|uniref:BBP7 family outer membrane beta-barrel protein n=1 Tax=Anatilimnocola floriformis TaxID=2948575 RepID=UPI0020C4F418|nr:BBP7 family outer membrane beta-barrel protein [Anatilimnocola floriformis]
MSLKRTKKWFLAILASMGAAFAGMTPSAKAEPAYPASAPTVQLERWSPFTEPDHFGPDLQFFAPFDASDYGGGDPPNIGFFFNYTRLYWNIQRPSQRPINRVGFEQDFAAGLNNDQIKTLGMIGFTGDRQTGYDGDFTWGNRYDFGYMTEDDHGWYASHTHVAGPAESLRVRQERINRINPDDTPPTNPDPILQDRNPRYYDLYATLNAARFSNIELNKVWRKKDFHLGGVLEPFVGARYMTFKDIYRQDGYGRYALDPDNFPDLNVPTPDGPVEVRVVDRAHFENNMLGGHIGFRHFYEKAHWKLQSEFRMFACHNFQYLTRYQDQTVTNYGDANGTDVVYELRNRARAFDRSDEFTWGGEVRVEAAYALTRDIGFRFGLTVMNFADGIGRGNDIRDNTEGLTMAGLNIGFEINR